MTQGSDGRRGADSHIWDNYWDQGRPRSLRNHIVEGYLYLVDREVRLTSHRPAPLFDTSDLRQVALMSLMKAVETWDPERNNSFEAWATFRIRNDISQALRTTADPLSRTLRTRAREIESGIDSLRQRNGQDPTREELAEFLGIDIETLNSWEAEISNRPQESLEARAEAVGGIVSDSDDTETLALRRDAARRLREALDRLDAAERELIVRVHIGGESLQQISARAGVSRGTVRTRYVKAFEQLRQAFFESEGN